MRTKLLALSIVACITNPLSANAAPIAVSSSLPLTGDDLIEAKKTLLTDEETQNFAYFIKQLDVFPDHANPAAPQEVDDRSKGKRYYIPPYFQASASRSTVGGQEISEEALKIVGEIAQLVSLMDYRLLKLVELRTEKERKNTTLNNLESGLPNLKDELKISTYKALISDLKAEIARLDEQIKEIEGAAGEGIASTSEWLRKQVASQIQLKLSLLGVVATSQEAANLASSSGNDMEKGISSMVARATRLGQYGFRNAIYEAGYTAKQRDWISLYRLIRQDVQVGSLTPETVYARSAALTSKNENRTQDEIEQSLTLFGGSQIVDAPRLILAVNGGSNGKCGNAKACNVVVEYTYLGAQMAKLSRTGAVIVPVYFEADISFMQPDFEGSVTCDFQTGFKVQGRADVKDGAIIYDGDVYNRIKYSNFEDGSCSYNIVKGSADSAAYFTLKSLYDTYMKLKMERAIKSRNEMDQYRNYVNSELQRHANQSQSNSWDFFGLSSWTRAFGNVWGTVASFVIGGARSFYWHTRIEDTSVTEAVKFTTTISESNVQKTNRITFDAFTTVCWKIDTTSVSMTPFLAACPTTENVETADTDLGKTENQCGDDPFSSTCTNTQPPTQTDENGVIEDPWGA